MKQFVQITEPAYKGCYIIDFWALLIVSSEKQGTKPVGGTSEDVCEGSHSSHHRRPGVQWSLFKLCKLVHLANPFP